MQRLEFRSQARAVLFLSCLAAALAACGSDDAGSKNGPRASAGCTSSQLKAGKFKISYAGVEYGYLVHVPPAYDGAHPLPLVLNWHGLTSYAEQQEAFSQMDAVSDSERFVLVYPDSPDHSWNAGTCCPLANPPRDDVAFGRALVKAIEDSGCIDTRRVYSTGMSNGGFMSHRLACEAADMFAAVAPVAGKVGIANCAPSRAVPVMHFHGTADLLVAYDTGALSGENLSVPDTLAHWALRDGCKKGPDQTYSKGTVTCQTWSECKDNVAVTLCTAQGEGHCWPGQSVCPYGQSTTDIDASSEMAKFFKRYALP